MYHYSSEERTKFQVLYHEANWSVTKISKRYKVVRSTVYWWIKRESSEDSKRSGRKLKYSLKKRNEIRKIITSENENVRKLSSRLGILRGSIRSIIKEERDGLELKKIKKYTFYKCPMLTKRQVKQIYLHNWHACKYYFK